MSDVRAIVGDYRWLPLRFDAASDSVVFVKADRDAHRAATFLDDQLLRQSNDKRQLRLGDIAPAVAALPAKDCHFIFHSAFCCSTLLARALDIPGKSMGLKEPLVLNDLVQAAMTQGTPKATRRQLEPTLALLARPFAAGETVIVKPSNIANPLIEEILELRPAAKALLLSSELSDFLRSVAKKGLWGRIWARKTLAGLNRFPKLQSGFGEAERWEHSDLQVAALVWLDHRAQFSNLLSSLPPERIVSMDSADLLDDPARALDAVGDFFGLGLSPDEVTSIARGPVFASNAKRHGENFDAQRRRDEHAAIGGVLAEEIEMVAKWARSVADFAGIPEQLPQPLLR
jgi:hypothetical protein